MIFSTIFVKFIFRGYQKFFLVRLVEIPSSLKGSWRLDATLSYGVRRPAVLMSCDYSVYKKELLDLWNELVGEHHVKPFWNRSKS